MRQVADSVSIKSPILRPELRRSQQHGEEEGEDTFHDKRSELQSHSLTGDLYLQREEHKRRSLKPAGPTRYLLSALQRSGYESDGRNYSETEPTLQSIESLENGKRYNNIGCTKLGGCRLSFQTITADYIQFVEPLLRQSRDHNLCSENDQPKSSPLDDALGQAFSDKNVRYLKSRGYDISDVVAWAWILRSENTHQAALRIFILEEDFRMKHASGGRRIPPFIPLFLLRQPVAEARTFRLLLIYCLHLISGQPLPDLYYRTEPEDADNSRRAPDPQLTYSMGHSTCMTLVIRLLRHARQVWPQAQLPIARAFAQYLADVRLDETHVSKRKSLEEAQSNWNQFKTQSFNKILWLLSLPSKQNPFVSIPVQQRAQFEILKVMSAHKPTLPVERRGYRGLVSVQLAHRKTPAERESAELKAPSCLHGKRTN